MLSLPASSPGYVSVFTAAHTGLYSLVLFGSGELKHDGDDLSAHASSNGQKAYLVYLAAGDVISYTGPASTLAGALQGDILEDL